MRLEKVSMTALVEKLTAIGGPGPLKQREWRIRVRLNWHHKAKSAVRHMLYGARQPTYQEAREIEAAHLKFCAERIRQMQPRMKLCFRPCVPLWPRWKRATRHFSSRTLMRCAKYCFSAGLRLLRVKDWIDGRRGI